MFRIYFKNTWRNMRKQKVTSFINISGLAIGMSCAVLILLWVQNELNYDNYHSGADNIYRIKSFVAIDKTSTWVWETSPYLLGTEVKKQIPEVQEVTRVNPFPHHSVNINGEFFSEKKAAYVDDRWFNMFHYEVVSGSIASFNSNPFSLVLTESAAKKYFGKGEAVGRLLKLDTVDFQVQAVIKDNPVNSTFQFDMMMPVAAQLANPSNLKNAERWGNFNYLTFVRLAPGSNKKKVTDKMFKILVANKKDDKVSVGLMPLKQMHFENDLQSSSLLHADRKVVYIFSVLGIILLLIACINYVNLTTARASLRMKEVSIKKIVGAGRKHLLSQFVFESALLSLVALVTGIGLLYIALPFFNELTEKQFKLSFSAQALWSILAGTFIVSVLLTSIYPALLLSSFKPILIFRGVSFLRVKDTVLRKFLVVVQFTVSVALIIGVLVVYAQLNFINSQHTSYDRSQVLTVNVPYRAVMKYDQEQRAGIMRSIKHALLSQPGIEQVSAMSQNSVVDMHGSSSGGADWDGRDPDFNPAIAYFDIDTNLNKVIDLPMTAGTWFHPGSGQKGYILNETAVREFGIRKPVIGQRFVGQNDTGQIIGVVKDFHYKSMHEKIGPMVIFNSKEDQYKMTMLIRLAPGNIAGSLKAAEKVWKEFIPGRPFEYSFLDEEFEKIYRSDRKTATLIWIFAGIAIFISCMGLFGLAAFTAEQRTKEVGIRKVLGASIASIIGLLSKDFIFLVLIAFVIASPLAWWGMNKWLQDFAYHINIGWWMFALAAFIAFIVAFATVSAQAFRAAVANPVKSLRSE